MKKIIFISLFTFLFSNNGMADEYKYAQFTCDLSHWFQDYYKSVAKSDIPPAQESIVKDLTNLLSRSSNFTDGKLKEIKNIDDIEEAINAILKSVNKKILLFVIPNSKVVNCWLGDISEERSETKEIFGQRINFTIVSIDKLEVHDYLYYLTDSKEMIDVGTKDDTIYFNREALAKKADDIWVFCRAREDEDYSRRYDPSKLNRLRKHLQRKSWQNMYAESIRRYGNEQTAWADFTGKAEELIRENSVVHEVAHLYVKNNPNLNFDISQEEEFAFLFEFGFGKLPYETIDTIVGIYAKGLRDDYHNASARILEGFAKYTKKEGPSPLLKDKIQFLYLLPEEEIRKIALDLLITSRKPNIQNNT